MKKIYFFAMFLFTTVCVQAQASACNDAAGGIQISFDYSMNCSAAPGDLAGMAEIGFHSGANDWSTGVDWDAADAVTAMNDGGDIFTVSLDPDAYYGVVVTDVKFVFNQGPATPATAWDSEGKMDDGAGGCVDFQIFIADITTDCATSANDLRLQNEIMVYPNPASDKVTISIDNQAAEIFTISLTTLTGQLVQSVTDFNGTNYELNKGNLASGIYFVKIQSESGKFATEKVVFK
jgi:hypothetical protein